MQASYKNTERCVVFGTGSLTAKQYYVSRLSPLACVLILILLAHLRKQTCWDGPHTSTQQTVSRSVRC